MRVFYSLFSIAVILGLLCSILGGSAASSPLLKRPYYGISPQDENYYKTSSDIIKCKDGSNKFTKTQLNDDYCDCLDGTDEPDCCDGSDEYDGKVNCPNTCWEAGKVARDKLKKKIATYQEGVTLRNREIEKAKLGLAKDEEELSKLKNEEKTLKGLVQQLKEHKEQIETAEEKERLQREKEEREKKEAEEKAQREKSESGEDMQENNDVQEHTSSEKKPEDSTRDNKVSVLEHASKDQDMTKDNAEDDKAAKGEHDGTSDNVEEPVNEVEQIAAEKIEQSASPKREDNSEVVLESGHDAGSELSHEVAKKMGNDASETTEELSREELGRLVASRWARENTEKESKENGAKDKVYEVHEKLPDSTNDDEDDGYAPDTDYHTERYDDAEKYDDHIDNDLDESYKDGDHDVSSYKSDTDDDSDLSETTGPSWLEKMQQTVRNLLKAVNLFQTPVDKSDADRVRKDYEESSAKLSKLQSRISSLTKKLEHDFGPEKEFYSFYGHCFESKQNKYLYKVCPYKEATQEEGHSSTRMGSWDKFEDSYHFMLFSNGDKCWNGPDRSLKVKLRCGLSNEVTDVDEPSRCEYVALLSTPALCLEEKLWELQHKLDLMNKEQPKQRDEL